MDPKTLGISSRPGLGNKMRGRFRLVWRGCSVAFHGGLVFIEPTWKLWLRQLGWLLPTEWAHVQHVPNHQADGIYMVLSRWYNSFYHVIIIVFHEIYHQHYVSIWCALVWGVKPPKSRSFLGNDQRDNQRFGPSSPFKCEACIHDTCGFIGMPLLDYNSPQYIGECNPQ